MLDLSMYKMDAEWEQAYIYDELLCDEVSGLIDLAELLDFTYPHEIYEVAQVEGWWVVDDFGDKYLDKEAMNDTMCRRHENVRVLWVGDYIGVCKW